jgi:outer membrane protein with beta-barrel domain
MRLFLILLSSTCVLEAQSFPRNEITFSGGESFQIFTPFGEANTAVSLGGTYGYRFTPHITAEAGVFGVIDPYRAQCDRFGCSGQDNRFIQVPFGLKFTLPVRNDRFELSAGGGGLYQRFSVSNPNPDFGETGYSAWGGYFKAGVGVAIDRRRRFWLSATPRWNLANSGGIRDRWFMLTGDLSFRF